MRKILLFLSFLFITVLAFPQVKVGIKAGANFSSLYTYSNKQTHVTGLKTGTHFGASLNIPAGKNISILTEANYNMNGGSDKGSNLLKDEYKIEYFSIPVLFKYNFETGLSLYTGPQISFSFNAKSTNSYGTSDITDNLNEVEVATIFGAEYNFKNGLFLSGRYNLGQTNIVKREYGSSDIVKNRGFTLAFGCYFGKKK
ncbi:MAG: porin family protein [Sphingobacteriales bacterium]